MTNNPVSSVIWFFKRIPLTTLIIGGLFFIVLIAGGIIGLSVPGLISDSLQRFGMWGLFVLAMVPSIQSGTGPNLALPIGICAGLFSMVCAMEMGFTGASLLLVAAVFSIIIGALFGYIYGRLMNAVKGSEMAIATYTGFAITFLFCMIWLILPFSHPNVGMFLGSGLRQMVSLVPFEAEQLLENLWQFTVFGITIRTGTLLIFIIAAFLMWLFFRTKTGISISAVGMNPVFARATGLNVNRSRVIANMISTILAALGLIIYAQGYGFVQLYNFPLMMAFPAVAAILVGGANAHRSKIIHVVIGTFLFQGLITTGPPIFGRILEGEVISDAVRQVVQNGVILYALTKLKGDSK